MTSTITRTDTLKGKGDHGPTFDDLTEFLGSVENSLSRDGHDTDRSAVRVEFVPGSGLNANAWQIDVVTEISEESA